MKINYISVFCSNIRFLRQKHHLTKAEMAKRCNTSIYSISLMEKGILPPKLSADILFDIYRNFGVHPKDMFNKLPIV